MAINHALGHNPGGNPGGNPPEGGPSEGGLVAPAPQQVVIPVGDAKPMRALSLMFSRNCSQAEASLAAIRTYLNLNFNVLGFNSPMKKYVIQETAKAC
jgi:hypothetical protein